MIIESGIEPSFADPVNFIEKSARASGNMYGQDLVHSNTAGDKSKINKNPMPKQKVTTFATTSYYKSSSVCLFVCLSVCLFVPYLLRGPLTDLRQTWWVYVGGPRNCP